MRIKIVSDGTRHGTKVIDAETGDIMDFVREVRWHIDASIDYPVGTAIITVMKVPVELTAVAEVHEVRS